MMKRTCCFVLALMLILGCTTAFAEKSYEYSRLTDKVKVSDTVHLMVTWTESYLWDIPTEITMNEEGIESEMGSVVVYGSTIPKEKDINIYVNSKNEFQLQYEKNTDPDTGVTTGDTIEYDPALYALYVVYTPKQEGGTKINDIEPVTKKVSGADMLLRKLKSINGQDEKAIAAEKANGAEIPLTTIVTDTTNAQDNGYYSDMLTFFSEVVISES